MPRYIHENLLEDFKVPKDKQMTTKLKEKNKTGGQWKNTDVSTKRWKKNETDSSTQVETQS